MAKVILASILALAFALRAWGVNFGLPFTYHPDEGAVVMPALDILRTGDYRPFRLDYGSAYIYSLMALYIPLFLYGAWRGYFKYSFPAAFLAARLFTAALGTLTVLAVYHLGTRLAGRRAGLIAAAFIAIEPLHVSNSHFATTDVPMTFMITLACVRILDVYERGHWRDYLWAGLLIGLAASTKFIGGIVFGALLITHALRAKNWNELTDLRLAIGVVATVAGFLLGTPFALDLPYFLNWLVLNFSFYGSASGVPMESSWIYYLKNLLLGSPAPIAICGVLGWAWFVKQNWRRGVVLVAFPAMYATLISVQTTHYPRFIIPLVPFLAVGAGMFLPVAVESLAKRWGRVLAKANHGLTMLVMLVGVIPLVASVKSSVLLAGPDVRTLAFEWVNLNIPAEARIALDPTGPPLAPSSHKIYKTWNLAQHSPSWYIEQKIDYLIISEPRLLDPNLTLQTTAAYRELMTRFRLVQTFQGAMLGSDGIRIWVYQVAP